MVAFVAYMWTQGLFVLGMVYRNPRFIEGLVCIPNRNPRFIEGLVCIANRNPRFIEGLVCIANRNPRFIEGQVCAAKMDQWRDYEVAYMSRDT